jgi:hypothetical protein
VPAVAVAFALHTPPMPQPQSIVDPQPSGKPVPHWFL